MREKVKVKLVLQVFCLLNTLSYTNDRQIINPKDGKFRLSVSGSSKVPIIDVQGEVKKTAINL